MLKKLLKSQRVDQGSPSRIEESSQHAIPAERLGNIDQNKNRVLQANKQLSSLPVERPLCTGCDSSPQIEGHDFCSFSCFTQYNEQHNPSFWSQMEVKNGNDFSPPEEISDELEDMLQNQLILGHISECLFCHKKDVQGFNDFCSEACHQAAIAKAPLLLPVPTNHEAFEKVTSCFLDGRPTSVVRHVYKIVCTPNVTQAYEDYCSMLNSRREYPGANVQKLWSWDYPCQTWKKGWKVGTQLNFCQQDKCKTCKRVKHGYLPKDISVPRTQAYAGTGIGGYYVDDTALGRCHQGTKPGDQVPDPPPPSFDSSQGQTYNWTTLKSASQGLHPLYLVFFKTVRFA